MKNKFNEGDRVVALKEFTGPGSLELGKVYTVEEVSPDGNCIILESVEYRYPSSGFKLLADCVKVGSKVITSGYADIYDNKILTVSKRDKLGKDDRYCYFRESIDDSHNFNIEQIVRVIINSEDTTILEPGQEVTIAGIIGVASLSGNYILDIPNKIFEHLHISDAHKYVSDIVGYECSTGLFPEVKTLEDLTKVYLALKAREKEIEDAPKYYRVTSDGYEPNFTKGKMYKIKNPLNLEALYNFIDNSSNPNGFSGINYKHFTPVTEEEWKEQEGCWKVVEKHGMPEESHVYKEGDIITFKSTDTELRVINSPGHCFCSSPGKDNNAYIFKVLQIEDKYKFIKGIIGYEGDKGDFPVLKSAEDLTKVISALKEMDEKLYHRIGESFVLSTADTYWIPSEKQLEEILEKRRIYANTKALNIFDLSTDHVDIEIDTSKDLYPRRSSINFFTDPINHYVLYGYPWDNELNIFFLDTSHVSTKISKEKEHITDIFSLRV